MIKGLDTLEELRQNNKDNSHLFDDELLNSIKRELMTLSIIDKYFYSKHIIHDLYCLGATDEEIEIVKEVLK